MTAYLIVNADDFGTSPGVNKGIIRAHEAGIVTSSSLMVRRPFAEEAAEYARRHRELSLGLHVDLGEWVYSDADGWTALYDLVTDEPGVAREIAAQLGQFRHLVRRDPTHLDSHQHVHKDDPTRSAMETAAWALDVPLRHFDPRVRYCGGFYGQELDLSPIPGAVSPDALIGIIRRLEPGYTELCCHPASDRHGGIEVDTLCDPRVREALEDEGVELRSFHDLAAERPPGET
jgi:chitin disaccharide deacetylase